MGRESTLGQMDDNMRETLWMIRNKDMVATLGQMGNVLKK